MTLALELGQVSDPYARRALEQISLRGGGPAGPTGPQGPPGAAGPQGPPGVVADPAFQRRQGIGIQQAAPGAGASFSFNVAGAPYVDLSPGTWKVEAAATIRANAQDLAIIGLWNETAGAGYSGSGGSWEVVTVPATPDPEGWATLRTDMMLTIAVGVPTQRFRIWAIPWGGSVLQIGNSAVNSVPCAFMNAYLVGPGPQGPKGDVSSVPMDTWHLIGNSGEPAFTLGFVHYDTNSPSPSGGGTFQYCGFRKDPLGRVYLKGLLGATQAIAGGTTIFTLPAGYRPPRNVVLDTSNVGIQGCRIDVNGTGAVVLQAAASSVVVGSYITLDGLYFDTETVTQMPTGPAGPQGPAGTIPTPEAWHVVGAVGEPAFGASCTPSATDPPAFRKYLNTVWLRGVVNCPTSGSPALFTLPAGYRPSIANQRFWPWPGNGFVTVTSAGVVQGSTLASGSVDLSTVQFSVD